MTSAHEEIAEAEGHRWNANPMLAAHLDRVGRWREEHSASPLLAVLGQPREWTAGQLFALGQLLAHLRHGSVLLAELELTVADASAPSPDMLRAALRPDGKVHSAWGGHGAFLRFPLGRAAAVRELWSPVPAMRSLATPSAIPVLLGPTAASAVLGELRACTAVARWPAGQRTLSVLLTHPAGSALHTRYPQP